MASNGTKNGTKAAVVAAASLAVIAGVFAVRVWGGRPVVIRTGALRSGRADGHSVARSGAGRDAQAGMDGTDAQAADARTGMVAVATVPEGWTEHDSAALGLRFACPSGTTLDTFESGVSCVGADDGPWVVSVMAFSAAGETADQWIAGENRRIGPDVRNDVVGETAIGGEQAVQIRQLSVNERMPSGGEWTGDTSFVVMHSGRAYVFSSRLGAVADAQFRASIVFVQ